MFPSIPHYPFYFYPSVVVEPPDLVFTAPDWHALSQQKISGKSRRRFERAQKRAELEANRAEIPFSLRPMDKRHFPRSDRQPESAKKDTRWKRIKASIVRTPSKNYGSGTAIRPVVEAAGHSGQLDIREQPTVLKPWPNPSHAEILLAGLKETRQARKKRMREANENMAIQKLELERQKPLSHPGDVERAYWLT
jgi:hypothetical protein